LGAVVVCAIADPAASIPARTAALTVANDLIMDIHSIVVSRIGARESRPLLSKRAEVSEVPRLRHGCGIVLSIA
jgi:hypothetical protein